MKKGMAGILRDAAFYNVLSGLLDERMSDL